MKILRSIILSMGTVILSSALCAAQETVDPAVFKAPPREYGPMTWWHWINGHVTQEGITKDLTAMHEAGIRGVQMFNTHMYLEKGPVAFASEQWFSLVDHAIRTCASLGMKFTCTTAAGWSGSGGPWIDKDRAMKVLVYSETPVMGGAKRTISLAKPKIKDGFLADELVLAIPAASPSGQIAMLATKTMVENKMVQYPLAQAEEPATCLQSSEVLDVTPYCKEGTFKGELPEGEWLLLRFAYTLTGKKAHPAAYGGEGYEVDKLDADAVAYQWESLMGKICARNKAYLGTTFEGVLVDSYESSWQNWTGGMFDKFQKKYSYDLRPWMPLFTGRYVDSAARSEAVLHDFRLLCDELISEGFYGTLQRKAAENGLLLYAEPQGGPVPACAMEKVDVPMNEFWNPDAYGRYSKMKLTSSQAHLYGRKIVAAEAFTSKPEKGKWKNTPATMKKPGDLAFAAGINRYCFHTYAHQPLDYIAPGFALGRYGIMLSRHTTWWDFSPAWMQYITRCQYLLQQGTEVADVGFLFHDDIRYQFASGTTKMPDGYDHIILYPSQLQGAAVRDGRILLPCGESVAVLLVLKSGIHTPETHAQLEALSKQGGKVFFVDDKKPETGRLLKAASVEPDVDWGMKAEKTLFYRHLTGADYDLYFISNQSDRNLDLEPSFRAGNGRQAEFWDALDGRVRPAKVRSTSGSYVKVALSLAPYGSAFIVFRKPLSQAWQNEQPSGTSLVSSTEVGGEWKVEFLSQSQMPESIRMMELSSWSQNADERVKYYSGTARYTTTLTLGKEALQDKELYLNLGTVKDLAKVYVNGTYCGTVWTAPFRACITQALKAGKNVVEVEVVNTWVNRVIGDERLPEDLDYDTGGSKFTVGRLKTFPGWFYSGSQPKNRRRHTFSTWKHYTAEDPLLPAGLLGPVTIDSYKTL